MIPGNIWSESVAADLANRFAVVTASLVPAAVLTRRSGIAAMCNFNGICVRIAPYIQRQDRHDLHSLRGRTSKWLSQSTCFSGSTRSSANFSGSLMLVPSVNQVPAYARINVRNPVICQYLSSEVLEHQKLGVWPSDKRNTGILDTSGRYEKGVNRQEQSETLLSVC